MKKVFIFAAAIALTLASCGNKSQNAAEAQQDSTTTEATTEAGAEAEAALGSEQQATVDALAKELQTALNAKDSEAAATTLSKLQATYKELVAQGKLEEAKAYGTAIKKLVTDNAETIKSIANNNSAVSTIVDGIQKLPTAANTTAEQAKAAAEAISNAPTTVKNAAEKAANEAVDNAKQAAKDKVNSEAKKVSDKANAAVDNAKQKAADKVNEGKQKANDAVNKAAGKALKGLGL